VYAAYLIDYEEAKHDGVEAHMMIGKSCGSNSSRPCTFDQFMKKAYSNLGSYIANTQRKGPFLYDDPKYAKGPQDLDTTTQMARDLSTLETGAAKMDFNKIFDVGSGNSPIKSFITLMDKVFSYVQSLQGLASNDRLKAVQNATWGMNQERLADFPEVDLRDLQAFVDQQMKGNTGLTHTNLAA
jgi:hypothetical protein